MSMSTEETPLGRYRIEDADEIGVPLVHPVTVVHGDGREETRFRLYWEGREESHVFTLQEWDYLMNMAGFWRTWLSMGRPRGVLEALERAAHP